MDSLKPGDWMIDSGGEEIEGVLGSSSCLSDIGDMTGAVSWVSQA